MMSGPTQEIAKDINGNNIDIDANNDNQIDVSEALNVYWLRVGPNESITNITGIEYFTNLTYLDVHWNFINELHLTTLTNLVELQSFETYSEIIDLTGLTNLTKLTCSGYEGQTIDLSTLTALESLNISGADLSTLDISNNQNLKIFDGSYLSMPLLDISNMPDLELVDVTDCAVHTVKINNCPSLKKIFAQEGQMSVLEFFGAINLEELNCYDNNLSELNLAGINKLAYLDCSFNNISGGMFLSDKPDLYAARVFNNQLTSLYVKNGHLWGEYEIFFNNNPDLSYICVGDDQYDAFRTRAWQSGFTPTELEINSYCSFVPGAIYNEMQGSVKFDSDNNGCSANDNALPNVKFQITTPEYTSNIIADPSGNFNIPVVNGQYTVMPVLEVPSYFNVSPSNVTVSFPEEMSPYVANYCISANGAHPDLEILLIPITIARPGFDALYKIVYRNKGSVSQSGNIDIAFNDNTSDFVSTDVTMSAQVPNLLSWNFSSLQPFESRAILFTLNINSPTEFPAVNLGDTFSLNATVASIAVDEMQSDNTFELNQTVVNSVDPNDKTCLEGDTVAPTAVGEYVHYMIRFENVGTFAAENIVVADMIDDSKFDISSLVPLSSSHSFQTRISPENKVEFIFENIMLPFDDANNDGYIGFKIKTLPTLTLGDTFSNTASIYFDYNFPIVTNTAATTITALGVADYDFGSYFTLYPVPASNVLNIKANKNIDVKSIGIYNILGQLVLAIPNANGVESIDTSVLVSGNYFLKVTTDLGSSSTSFIRQ